VLEGLENEKMNGKQGVFGRFDPETECRAIYIPELKKQMWAKHINIRLLGKKLLLSDVKDRLGGVSLHEVMMGNRVDVAYFLLSKHGTSIRTKDADGLSPLDMTMGGGMMWSNEVWQMIPSIARSEAATRRTKAKNAQKKVGNVCRHCHKSLGRGGSACSKCTVTFYCGREC